MRFFANRASTRYARALERGDISPQQCVCGLQTALFSSPQVLQATKESCQRVILECGFFNTVSGQAGRSWKMRAQPAKGGSLGMSEFNYSNTVVTQHSLLMLFSSYLVQFRGVQFPRYLELGQTKFTWFETVMSSFIRDRSLRRWKHFNFSAARLQHGSLLAAAGQGCGGGCGGTHRVYRT